MIRKLTERFSFVARYNANDHVVLAGCDNCVGEFLFAAMKTNREGPSFITGEFYQFELLKFCPFCGARNTKPRPVAERDPR